MTDESALRAVLTALYPTVSASSAKKFMPTFIGAENGSYPVESQYDWHLAMYVLYCFCVPSLQALSMRVEALHEMPLFSRLSLIQDKSAGTVSFALDVFLVDNMAGIGGVSLV